MHRDEDKEKCSEVRKLIVICSCGTKIATKLLVSNKSFRLATRTIPNWLGMSHMNHLKPFQSYTTCSIAQKRLRRVYSYEHSLEANL